MSKKQLIIKADPLLRTNSDYAHLSLIIQEDERSKRWLYNHFIQLFLKPWEPDNPLRFFYQDGFGDNWYALNPCVDYQILTRASVRSRGREVIDFFVSELDTGYCIRAYLNEFYVPERESFNRQYLPHPALISGYDLEEQTFDLCGFAEQGYFKMTRIPFEAFLKAFFSYEEADNYRLDHILLMKVKSEKVAVLDIDVVLEQLEDYVSGRNSSERYRIYNEPVDALYGVDIYLGLIGLLYSRTAPDQAMNLKPFYLLWEHKTLMLRRLEMLDEHGVPGMESLARSYRSVESKVQKARNIYFKFTLTHDPFILPEIVELLIEVQHLEASLLTRAIEYLTRYKETTARAAKLVSEAEAKAITMMYGGKGLIHETSTIDQIYIQLPEPYLQVGVATKPIITALTSDKRLFNPATPTLSPADPNQLYIDEDHALLAKAPGIQTIAIKVKDTEAVCHVMALDEIGDSEGWRMLTIGQAQGYCSFDPSGLYYMGKGVGIDAWGDQTSFLARGVERQAELDLTVSVNRTAHGMQGMAGIMLREDHSPCSPMFMLLVDHKGEISYYRRERGVIGCTANAAVALTEYPVELRITLEGARLTAYYNKDNGWLTATSCEIEFSDHILAGASCYSKSDQFALFQLSKLNLKP